MFGCACSLRYESNWHWCGLCKLDGCLVGNGKLWGVVDRKGGHERDIKGWGGWFETCEMEGNVVYCTELIKG